MKRAYMMNRETNAVDRRSVAHPKKVHWALNLEEIVYFTPLPTPKAVKRTSSSFAITDIIKSKADLLKCKHFKTFLNISNSDLFLALQKTFARIAVEKRSSHLELDIADSRNLNRPWDELFELYAAVKQDCLRWQLEVAFTRAFGKGSRSFTAYKTGNEFGFFFKLTKKMLV